MRGTTYGAGFASVLARSGTASTRVSSCALCIRTSGASSGRLGGCLEMVRLTAARTALISASARVATATSGASLATDLGALSADVGFSALHPLTISAATPTVPAISERLEVASPRAIALPEEGKSTTEGILDG